MRKLSLLSKVSLLVFLGVATISCSSNKKPPKESDEKGVKVDMQVLTSLDANPNTEGKAAPIRLDFYQLSADAEFSQADFFDLVQKPKDALGDKLIQSNQYMLYPDAVMVLSMKLDSNLKYFGAVASYRNLENKEWRTILFKQSKPWYKFKKNYLYLYIDNSGINQLSRQEMHQKLKEYQTRHPGDKTVRNGKARPEKNDMSKGIFRRANIKN